MKSLFTKLAFFIFTFSLHAQVGIGTTSPDASAALDISATDAGILIPRMTQSQRDGISSPATGLLIYQSDNITGFYYYNGSTWVSLSGGGTDNDWTIAGNDIYNANSGNIGIGNAAPSAKFHLTGTTIPGSSGGSIDLLNEDFSSYSVNQNYTPDADCSTNGWEVTSTGDSNSNCANCTGDFLFIDTENFNCAQNATAIITFSSAPATTSVTINFDYRFNSYTSDSFRAYLYNDTTSSQVGADLVNATTDVNTSYSNTVTVNAGDTYSLRFEYIGDFDYGATVDNIIVSETAPATSGTYILRLEDGQQQNGYILTSDANGNATWMAPSGGGADDQTIDLFNLSGNVLSLSLENDGQAPLTVDLSSLSGGGGSYSFENGLTESSGTVRLGGTLTQNTTIDLNTNDFALDGDSKRMMTASSDVDFVSFGNSTANPDTDFDNQTFTIDGDSYTLDVVLGYHRGASGGSSFKMGSVEYMVDGGAELFLDGASALSPFYDAFSFADLGTTDNITNFSGTSTGEWEDIYVQNTVTVSDRKTKDNISELNYGLKEILALQPVSFDYKKQIEKQNKYNVPSHLRKKKLGFVAQEVLEILPEVVKTHDWKVTNEASKTVALKENNIYGIMYADIVPVLVNAIQEQQKTIEQQQDDYETLKRRIEKLEEDFKKLSKR